MQRQVKILLSLISIAFLASSVSRVEAQAERQCGTFNPKIADRCYQDVSINARSGYPGRQPAKSESTRFSGWRIVGYDRPATQAQFGEVSGPNITFAESGTNAELRSTLESFNRELLDLKNKLESKARFPVAGVPIEIGGVTESINKSLRENEQRFAALSAVNTNTDIVFVNVTVGGRCTRYVLGVCLDNQGGKYEGYVRVHMVYVGTPEQIRSINQPIIETLKLIEQPRWNQIVAIRGDMLLFYDREPGQGEIYRIELQGNLTFLRRYDGWRTTWSNISSLGNSRVRFVDDNNHSEIYSVNDQGVFSDAN